MSCEHGNWSPCEACDKEAALHARIEALEQECGAMRAMIQVAIDVLDEVRGNINPERGYVDELEADVERAIATIARPAPTIAEQDQSNAEAAVRSIYGAQPAPSIEAAEAMGAKGGPVVEAERLAFEAWMRGHCWKLGGRWNGTEYLGDKEHGGGFDPHAMQTRLLWAAWRDRAALAAEAKP